METIEITSYYTINGKVKEDSYETIYVGLTGEQLEDADEILWTIYYHLKTIGHTMAKSFIHDALMSSDGKATESINQIVKHHIELTV